jgi:hypothetical protein
MLHMTPPAPAASASVLASRAVLAKLNLSVWTARKFDKRVTADVVADHGAAADAGRWNKALVARDALSGITTAASRARDTHYTLTLPWSDDGARILPVTAHAKYVAAMRGNRTVFEEAVESFVVNYPAYVEAARARLNGMFNAADYPAPAEISGRFNWSNGLDPIPCGADFRVDVEDAIRADVDRRVRDATGAAMADAMRRVADVVGTMAAKLADYRPAVDGHGAAGVFRDSLIENVRDLAGILPDFNLTDSPAFRRVAETVAVLSRPEPDAYRTDDTLRAEAAATAAALAAEAARMADEASAFF